jgi:hypothetical protein
MQQWQDHESGLPSEASSSSSSHETVRSPGRVATPSRRSANESSRASQTEEMKKREGMTELVSGSLEVLAGLIFVVGSVCFLPQYTRNINVFVFGCLQFIVGGCIYVGLSGFALLDAVHKGVSRSKLFEHFLFFIGSIIFVYGTILFWPESSDMHVYVEALKEMSIVQYYDLMLPELEATVLFMIGSAIFALAAVLKVLGSGPEDDPDNQIDSLYCICHLLAGLLFVIGSVPYLPPLQCTDYQVGVGACCFIVGSVIFMLSGVTGLKRSWGKFGHHYNCRLRIFGTDEANQQKGETEPLLKKEIEKPPNPQEAR